MATKRGFASGLNVYEVALKGLYDIKVNLERRSIISNWTTQSIGNRQTKFEVSGSMTVNGKKTTGKLGIGFMPSRSFVDNKLGYDGTPSHPMKGEAFNTWGYARDSQFALSDKECLHWLLYFIEQLCGGIPASSESKGKVIFATELIELLHPAALEVTVILSDSHGNFPFTMDIKQIGTFLSGFRPLADTLFQHEEKEFASNKPNGRKASGMVGLKGGKQYETPQETPKATKKSKKVVNPPAEKQEESI